MYRILAGVFITLLVGVGIWKHNSKIESLQKEKNKLEKALKICEDKKEAKEFEFRWESEFNKAWTKIDEKEELEDEKNSTQSDSSVFSDTF